MSGRKEKELGHRCGGRAGGAEGMEASAKGSGSPDLSPWCSALRSDSQDDIQVLKGALNSLTYGTCQLDTVLLLRFGLILIAVLKIPGPGIQLPLEVPSAACLINLVDDFKEGKLNNLVVIKMLLL